MELQEVDFAVGAATAVKALSCELREAIAAIEPGDYDCSLAGHCAPPRLQRAVRQADQLASNLLAYAGVQPLAPTKLELLPILADLADRLRRTLDERIDVIVDVGHDCPPCYADGDALLAALLNLAINSRDAMPDGGTIQLSAKAAEANGTRPSVAIAVTDNGAGMAADFARLAVRPFVTTKANRPDAGMGLAAANGFARQSGGHLELSCWTSRGLTATLFLPRHLGE